MSSKIYSAAIVGLEGQLVEVETDILGQGLHNFTIVGLPDTAIKESRDRVSSAIKNSGFKPPHQCGRITVNLAPADLPKESPIYDLPIALGFLLSSGQLDFDIKDNLFAGELSLDGRIRPINGSLPIALFARKNGIKNVYLPEESAYEASVIKEINIIPVKNLFSLVRHLCKEEVIQPLNILNFEDLFEKEEYLLDMSHIKGQEHAKRALEISAAGGHNVILNGPPGSGKTLLAKAMPSILPKLNLPEALEITKIFSISGKLPRKKPIITVRPFRSPHHSSSAVSLVGGGTYPKPGEISLAHRGVLFLDEFAEFPKNVLENLRQPLEDGLITVSRAKGSLEFPAQFILIAAMNPCPCGNATDPEKLCSCNPGQIIKYQKKISGPILDRIDLHVEVPRLSFDKLQSDKIEETSEEIRKKVEKAREKQMERFEKTPIFTNSEMSPNQIKQFCNLSDECKNLLRMAISSMKLSARAYHRIIKVARTAADLNGQENITPDNIAEAVQYRFKTE